MDSFFLRWNVVYLLKSNWKTAVSERRDSMDETWQQLKEWIDASRYIVFFGGAGVSTESGIPDFRSVDGLYNQTYKYPPEPLSATAFLCAEQRNFTGFTGSA